MTEYQKLYYEKRGQALVKNLQQRQFEAYYCADKAEALAQALTLIPEGSSVGWGGCASVSQIGLLDAVREGSYNVIDRDTAASQEERMELMRKCLLSDVFLTGANAISMDGQMVNIDGNGNRVAAVIYGPKTVIAIVGMNKVTDSVEDAVRRARTVAAPLNNSRFGNDNPCSFTGTCGNCKNEKCICNHIVITRHCRPVGRIKFVIVGEDLGL